MTTDQNAIEVKGLSKSFRRGSFRLEPITFAIPQGAFCALLGVNGSGKSTLLKMLLGLVKPDAGTGNVLGRDIREKSVEVRKTVGYVEQLLHFEPSFTPKETLEFVARFWQQRLAPNTIEQALEEVGLAHLQDQPIAKFSGGEIRRLGIAQALIHAPQLLFVDELTGLDLIGQERIPALLCRAHQKGMTILMTTHSLEQVEQYCDHVLMLTKNLDNNQTEEKESSLHFCARREVVMGEVRQLFGLAPSLYTA